MGYDGPKGDQGGLGKGIQGWNMAQKNLENNTGLPLF